MNSDASKNLQTVSQEKIELDIQKILASALNAEVINQRKMAKQQYVESQGFGNPQGMQGFNKHKVNMGKHNKCMGRE